MINKINIYTNILYKSNVMYGKIHCSNTVIMAKFCVRAANDIESLNYV